jgi:riboflavin transporter FmnP
LILVGLRVDGKTMSKILSPKSLTFIAMMAALGNVLSFISIKLAPLMPTIPLGPTSFSLALDLSHLSTFIAALFGGPAVGGLTALIGSLVAAFEFGFSQGNFITGFGLPLGKTLTGLTAGILMRRLVVDRSRVMMVVSTVVSYIPEGIVTYIIFMYLFPLFIPGSSFWVAAMTVQVLVKAEIEMVVMGVLLAALIDNQGFTQLVKGYFS